MKEKPTPTHLVSDERARLPRGYQSTYDRAKELEAQALSSLRATDDAQAHDAIKAALTAVVASCRAAIVREDQERPVVTPIRQAKAWRPGEGPHAS